MSTKHSKTSPSNYERRVLCRGSLNAELGCIDKPSKYASEGTMLHEVMANKFNCMVNYDKGLTTTQVNAINTAVNYVNDNIVGQGELYQHMEIEGRFSLDFIEKGMKGSCDLVVVTKGNNEVVTLHIADYKFGKHVPVEAVSNSQLFLYYLAYIKNNATIARTLKECKGKVKLHIIQPYVTSSCWSFEYDEEYNNKYIEQARKVLQECADKTAKRTYSKSGCMFCKAKSTCQEYKNKDLIRSEEDKNAILRDIEF